MRLSEIAAALALPQSSASMLVRSMVSMGYLVYATKSRSYMPSMRLTLLGNWLNEGTFANGNLKTLVGKLSHLTGDTVILATRNDTLVEVLGVTQGHMDTLFHTRPGDARPLTRALLGHMILSALNRTEVEGLVSRINSEQKLPERRVSYRSLMPVLDGIRQNGYGFNDGVTFPGHASIAMLLPNIPTGETLVIANAGSTDRIRTRQAEILKFMRATITEHFG
jgi:DNA-binding IclR family transcriptional regulator